MWIPLPGIMLLPMVSGSRNSGQTMLGRSAPLRRNRQIVEYADLVLLFWDGSSHGTRHVLELCRTLSKPHHLFTPGDPQN